MKQQPASIEKLKWIMQQLRDPKTGCPWDIKQTFTSIVPHTLEEAYEVAETIEQQDYQKLPNELGDLLFQVIFYSQLGEEQQRFNFDDVIYEICEKLIRRHPHVFADTEFSTEQDIKRNWENEKAKERLEKQNSHSVLADIPLNLPALSQAQKIQKRCAHIGFDWPEINPVINKVAEELDEVKQAIDEQESEQIAEEIGDLLFACVNLSRHAGFDAETLLRQANRKFSNRFQLVENKVAEQGKTLTQLSLTELDNLWEQVKQSLKSKK